MHVNKSLACNCTTRDLLLQLVQQLQNITCIQVFGYHAKKYNTTDNNPFYVTTKTNKRASNPLTMLNMYSEFECASRRGVDSAHRIHQNNSKIARSSSDYPTILVYKSGSWSNYNRSSASTSSESALNSITLLMAI